MPLTKEEILNDNEQGNSSETPTVNPVHLRNRELKLLWDAHIKGAEDARAEGDSDAESDFVAQARETMSLFFSENSGLAYAAARPYLVSNERDNHDDYVSAAFVGLLEAFPMWDPRRGTFATFSRPYADGVVRRTVRTYTRPEISYGDYTSAPTVSVTEARLRVRLGRAPSDAEIAAESGLSVGVVTRCRAQRPGSLDVRVGEGDTTRGDLVADEVADDNTFDGLSSEQEAALLDVLASLSPHQRVVAARRFALDGAPAQTLSEIGQMFGGSRESVRRAETLAQDLLKAALADIR